jgi:hypothetical protein
LVTFLAKQKKVMGAKTMSDVVDFLLLPEQSLPLRIQSTKDIYEHRNLLKQLLLSESTINYLMDIIIKSVNNKSRFRTLDCLKVLRAILRNNPFDTELSKPTIRKLFFLHQTFILHKSKEVRACANSLVLSRCLDDESIKWIIANWEKSDHLQNRLLRYPVKNSLISQWANEIYESGKLKDRISEVIALLIDENIPSYIKENKNTIVWSIYYARTPDSTKQRLLMENFSKESADSLWKVATRLKYPDVVQFMRQKILAQQNGG